MGGVALHGIAGTAVDADRDVAGHGDAVQPPGRVVVVVHRVVLGDPVVEQHQLARLPGDPQDVLRAGDVLLQDLEDLVRLALGQAHDALGEPADEQAALPGQRVHPDHGVGGLVLGGEEDLAALPLGLVQALRRHRVVVVVGVHCPQRVREGAQRSGQVPVGRAGVGDQGLAAVRRDDDAAQGAGLGRVQHEGDVRVPVVDPAVLAVDRQDVRLAVDGGHGRVRGGQRAEVAGEPLLVLVVQADAAEDERLVLVQRRPDLGDGLGVEGEVGAEAGDLRADAGGDLADAQLRTRGSRGHGGSFSARDGRVGAGAAPLRDRVRCIPA